jgi:hypothetical protein
MSWFGWLTKGSCEISGLDRIIGTVEVFAVIVILFILFTRGKK